MKQREIEALLPEIFRRTIQPNSLLDALLAVMEGLPTPSEDVLENIDHFFDPYRTPERFVHFLAAWVDLTPLLRNVSEEADQEVLALPVGSGWLRELIAAAAEMAQWRGTRHGMQRFLETATGLSGYEIDEHVSDDSTGEILPYHIRVRAPQAAKRFQPLVEKLIEMEKPAYVTYRLEFLE
jgi:phage tail-like protein